MPSPVRVRFAPSPTGYLHIGGARTALFNWLYARHTGGTFVLRVEDTDQARNTEEAARAIYDGLSWLGLDWDEGPQAGGEFGPYFQSQREEIYLAYLEKLRAAGRVYDDSGAVRFRFEREKVVMDDVICGHVEIDMANPETNPDMTIRRPDGSWIFHFVNVVDDIEMKISHVIRGEDHLSNTPKHIQLYRALGATPPRFAHIPLILNPNGSKMSKRDQGASVAYYVKEGFLPEAVRNYLCLLGWSPKDGREKIDIDDIVRIFNLSNIVRSPATFNPVKLRWLNGEYMRALDPDRYHSLGIRRLLDEGVAIGFFTSSHVRRVIASSQGKLKTFAELRPYVESELRAQRKMHVLADIPGYVIFEPEDVFEYDPVGKAKHFQRDAKDRLVKLRDAFAELTDFNSENLEKTLKEVALNLGVKPGALVQPLRLAVSGEMVGRGLYEMLEDRGQGRVLALINQAIREIIQQTITFRAN